MLVLSLRSSFPSALGRGCYELDRPIIMMSETDDMQVAAKRRLERLQTQIAQGRLVLAPGIGRMIYPVMAEPVVSAIDKARGQIS
jgi:hypothetical protein